MKHEKNNRLNNETSPYLLQHAHNPVDWYAWNDEALQKATAEDKPIFLSIGYSACHWCHVMAHESFEDDDTAKLMNAHFINIKVDKEERPDLDKIYQAAQFMLTQRGGGWPLSMFLTPDRVPFFGGTYFPPTARHGLPGFKDVLLRIADIYQHKREMINDQNHNLLAALRRMEPEDNNGESPDLGPIGTATEQLYRNFDAQFGGFGGAPKFPQVSSLEFLLRQSVQAEHSREQMLQMLDFTLHKMITGGFYDQLGGGFYRYTVDREWMIPHFEKMLYDNGLLLTLCSQAWQIIQKPLLKKTVCETASWVIREMQDPAGGYYSSLDADSEGVEGKFYVWTPQEVGNVLDKSEYTMFARHYGLDQAANFDSAWHLYRAQEPEDQDLSIIERARAKLLEHRTQRIRPHCDDKILTAWNALMIKGMATAGFVFGDESYVDSAEQALSFIAENLYEDGCLLATCRDGNAHLNAYLDDYAFMIDAILAFLQCRWQRRWLEMAVSLADKLLEAFADQEQGGFFFTADNHETLIHRGKYFTDDSFPAGNGVAAAVLNKLGHLIGEQRYPEAAESVLKNALPVIKRQPLACSTLLNALQEILQPPGQIIVFADPDDAESWRDKYRGNHNPCDSFMILPPTTADLPGRLGQYSIERLPVAYICSGRHCQEPVFDADILVSHLHNISG